MRKVNAVVTEAIAKYDRLGKEAPADLRKLAAETANVEKASTGLGTTLGSLKTAFLGAFGGFTAANLVSSAVLGIKQMAGDIVRLGGEMVDLSAKTGVSTTALQRWKYARSRTATPSTRSRPRSASCRNASAAKKAPPSKRFAIWACRSRPCDGSPRKKQFDAIAEALAKVDDQNKLAAYSMDLFGRAGTQILRHSERHAGARR